MEGLDPYLWTRRVEYEGTEKITGKRTTCLLPAGPRQLDRIVMECSLPATCMGKWESLPEGWASRHYSRRQSTHAHMNNLCGGVFITQLPLEFSHRCSIQFGAFSPVFWFHGFWGIRMPGKYWACRRRDLPHFSWPAL